MQKVLFLLALMIIGKYSIAQNDSTALYLQFPNVPPFTIIKVPDNTEFSKADLKKKTATLIITFSPDCDHCKHETKELLSNIDLFKNVQIVMVSHLDFDLINKFYQDFQITTFPTITMGRDAAYFLGTFYGIKTYPSMFLYDKKGRFIKMFEGSVPIKQIAALF